MRKILLITALIIAVLLTGCTLGNEADDEGAAFVEELSTASNASAAKNLKGEILFYPAYDIDYKTGNNEMFDFWFDIPVEWNAVDKSDDGSEYCILPGNDNIDLRIFGILIDEPEESYYKKLAGANGIVTDFIFRDGWAGKMITVSEDETYYVRVDGDSYMVLYINTVKDHTWKSDNEEIINYIAMSARTTRESFGKTSDEVSTISPDDIKLGEIDVSMTYEELINVMGHEPIDVIEEEYEGMKTKMLFFSDDTQVYVVNDTVYTVNVTSPDYATPRGLKTGDSEDRILELYGEPNRMEDGIWGYFINGYELLTIVVEDEVVAQIQIEQGVWSAEVF